MSKTLEQLIAGYYQFHENYFNIENSLYENLVQQGQQPAVMVIACSDSRVDPAIVMNCQPGDLFVVRNVANLVPPCEEDEGFHGTSAALEFAVNVLNVRDIVIFGHSQCGGIKSLVEQQEEILAPSHHFISNWMKIAEPAYREVIEDQNLHSLNEKIEACCQKSLVNSLTNLETFPWIKKRLKSGKLFLHSWYFELSSGKIYAFDQQIKTFMPLLAG